MLPTYLRFEDLREAGIVANWPTLKVWVDKLGFPSGRMLGPKTRVWTEAEIASWLATRPKGGSETTAA